MVRIRVTPAAVVLAATLLVASLALTACGSATTSGNGTSAGGSSTPSAPAAAPTTPASPSAGPSVPRFTPPPGAPMITAIRLTTSFAPSTISLAAGQKFEVLVAASVAPAGSGFPQPCASGASYPVAGGMLSVTCPSSGDYTYTAEHSGTTALTATLRPKCAPGQMCPQWITEATLTVTVT